MHIYTDPSLIETARGVAREMLETNKLVGFVFATEQVATPAKFVLQRSSAGMTVFADFVEENQIFYLGIEEK